MMAVPYAVRIGLIIAMFVEYGVFGTTTSCFACLTFSQCTSFGYDMIIMGYAHHVAKEKRPIPLGEFIRNFANRTECFALLTIVLTTLAALIVYYATDGLAYVTSIMYLM